MSTPPRLFNVLFLCTGNSARSVIAESMLNSVGRGRFRAFSAGSHPTGKVNPFAIEYLKLNHLPTEGLRSKSWEEFAATEAPRLGVSERWLTLWVALCIVAGIALGQWFPEAVQVLGRMEIARVNVPVGLLIWVMIIPMLLRIDFGALHRSRSRSSHGDIYCGVERRQAHRHRNALHRGEVRHGGRQGDFQGIALAGLAQARRRPESEAPLLDQQWSGQRSLADRVSRHVQRVRHRTLADGIPRNESRRRAVAWYRLGRCGRGVQRLRLDVCHGLLRAGDQEEPDVHAVRLLQRY